MTVIANSTHPKKSSCLDSFFEMWQHDSLVVGKWFTIQATASLPGTLDEVKRLIRHSAFDLRMPNHVRSLIGAFSQSNSVNFHQQDGSGYQFLADYVIELNSINPQIASRMLTALTPWRRYDVMRQEMMKTQLSRIVDTPNLSPDVYEVASKALA